jgi:hypothetical protein
MGMPLKSMLLLALLALSPGLQAYLTGPEGVTLSVKAGGKQVNSNDLVVSQKEGYVYVMFNATPYLDGIPGGKAGLKALVTEMVKKEGLTRYPKEKLFKIDVADISARDDYGMPAWDKIKLIERYTAKAGKKGLMVEKVKAAP